MVCGVTSDTGHLHQVCDPGGGRRAHRSAPVMVTRRPTTLVVSRHTVQTQTRSQHMCDSGGGRRAHRSAPARLTPRLPTLVVSRNASQMQIKLPQMSVIQGGARTGRRR